MFERFDEASRSALVLAGEYRVKHRHSGVEPVDLLCAVASIGGVAGMVLSRLDLDRIAEDVEPDPGFKEDLGGQHSFTPAAKTVLENGLREALGLGWETVAPHHILLALTRDESMGDYLEREQIREDVIHELMKQPSEKHLVEWTIAMAEARSRYLELVRHSLALLSQPSVPLFDLRRNVDDVATAAEEFRSVVEQTVLRGVAE